jgi:hypothetical protein
LTRDDPGVGAEAITFTGRHQIQTIACKPNDFGLDARTVARDDVAVITDGGLTPDGL